MSVRTSRIRYIFTWISLVVLMICTILLMAGAWNSRLIGSMSPSLLFLLWMGISASGIYLFLLAVKKAHRQWINEKREQEKEEAGSGERPSERSAASRGGKTLDFAATARKIIRRVPDNIAREELGQLLLKNLASELEIMSGLYYEEKRGIFSVQASYATTPDSESFTFKSGESLPGQAAKNQQIMLLTRLPEDYTEVYSGLGKAPPGWVAIVPLVHKGKTRAVVECSGYRHAPGDIENMFRIFARELMEKLSPKLS